MCPVHTNPYKLTNVFCRTDGTYLVITTYKLLYIFYFGIFVTDNYSSGEETEKKLRMFPLKNMFKFKT